MRKIFLCISILIALTSCNDYLDIEPKGKIIATSIEDYQLLLNNIRKHDELKDELFLSCDDFHYPDINLGDLNNPTNQDLHLYTFSENRNSNPEIASNTWNALYSNIYVYNKVISEIDKADTTLTHGEKQRLLVKGNAHFNRALQYFYLVNVFAKHYSESSANSPGVPLILEADVSKNLQTNNTIKEVYDLIENDLKTAVKFLGDNKDGVKVGKAAGYALLSRVNLYKSNYTLALDNANLALGYHGQLSDYTTALSKDEAAEMLSNERYGDIYKAYTRYGSNISSSAVALFETQDTRDYIFLGPSWSAPGLKLFDWSVQVNTLPKVGEMYLTIAECEARKGNKANAITKLNDLRKKRINMVQDKVASDFSDDTALLKFILEERRRELLTTTIRLFELKRLNLDSRFETTFSHKVLDKVYLAEPNSGKLVIPIPANVKKYNKSL